MSLCKQKSRNCKTNTHCKPAQACAHINFMLLLHWAHHTRPDRRRTAFLPATQTQVKSVETSLAKTIFLGQW